MFCRKVFMFDHPCFFQKHCRWGVFSNGALYGWSAVISGRPIIFRFGDFFRNTAWVYIDAPREHQGYARFVRRYSPLRLRRTRV